MKDVILSSIKSKRASGAISNIGQLFEALAVDWKADGRNRILIAGDGGQFVRLPENRFAYPYYKKEPNDIPVDSGHYLMRGFIQFEARTMFRDLFKTDADDDGTWFSAELTQKGLELAQCGILDFDWKTPDIKRCLFFNPALKAVEDLELPMRAVAAIASQSKGQPMTDQTQFDYLLNAFEQASQSEKPADLDYAGKRKALYAYVRGLEGKDQHAQQAVVSERTYSSVNQWLLSLPEDECAHINSIGKWELAEKVWSAARTQQAVESERGKALAEVAQALLDAGYTNAYEVVYKLQSQQPAQADKQGNGAAAANASGQEIGWCIERGSASAPQYLHVNGGILDWTLDNMKALRFARRADAEQLAEIAEDASRIAEHVWMGKPTDQGTEQADKDKP